MHVRFSQFDLFYVCFCKEEDYFVSIYPNTANSWPEILAQYALCITPNAFFVLFLLSALFFLPFFSSALKSCTLLVSRSELLQNCSAIRNCEFLNKTFLLYFT